MKRTLVFFALILFSPSLWALQIKSNVFVSGEYIDSRYSCSAEDLSPPLYWSDVPAGTESFALICDDPDAPVGTWVHWVIYNIPKDWLQLQENIVKQGTLADGTSQGVNDFGKIGYGGPCSPRGKRHRYFFKLYALDITLSLEEASRKKDLIKAMRGHILAEAKLIGLYKR